ncbi:MAG: DUF4442 domain-containing protein [Bdellovibrionaceae bacterium]|nr:DUF4442 domain-containing protein [Pseudobdellovibrionaceae bacterium]|tara:strand:+ start:19016 stop:19486 length:471 start_codon:yes stop_codon:yes gene_type:complete
MNIEMLKTTAWVNLFGLLKIPLILFISPRVIRLDEKVCEIKVPLNYRTKNHLGSMYFGALAIGADLSGALIGMKEIQKSKKKVSLVFKDMRGNFLKRATEDIIFYCDQVAEVKNLVAEAIEKKERVEMEIPITAKMAKSGDLAAEFVLTLSLKARE